MGSPDRFLCFNFGCLSRRTEDQGAFWGQGNGAGPVRLGIPGISDTLGISGEQREALTECHDPNKMGAVRSCRHGPCSIKEKAIALTRAGSGTP